jgi:diguanylate cyclase
MTSRGALTSAASGGVRGRSNMRYRETREQSGEILRAALTLMSGQEAPFHPLHYALWYEHVGRLNPELSRVLEERLAAGTALTNEEVLSLHALYVLARDAAVFERIEEQFRILLQEASHAVASASEGATSFSQTLEVQSARLDNPKGLDLIRQIVAELLTETRQMCTANRELAKQLDRTAVEVRKLSDRLERAEVEALLDPLTGLSNRRGFARSVDSLGSGTLEGAALLVIDIDHFKAINDTHGHLLGDKVLRAIAQILRACIRGGDASARIGGEEFAVLLPQTPVSGAVAVAEKIRAAIGKMRLKRIDRDESVGNITVSVGVGSVKLGDTFVVKHKSGLTHQPRGAGSSAPRSGPDRHPGGVYRWIQGGS